MKGKGDGKILKKKLSRAKYHVALSLIMDIYLKQRKHYKAVTGAMGYLPIA